RQHQVDEVLQRGQPLALASDQRPEGLAAVRIRHDVQAAGVAGLDLDADREADALHELLEDLLAGRKRLGRRLCSLEIRALGGERASGGLDLGGLRCAQVRRAAAAFARPAVAVIAAGRSILARGAVLAWPVGNGSVGEASIGVVSTGCAVTIAVTA